MTIYKKEWENFLIPGKLYKFINQAAYRKPKSLYMFLEFKDKESYVLLKWLDSDGNVVVSNLNDDSLPHEIWKEAKRKQ